MKFVPDDLKPYLKMSLAFHGAIFVTFGMKVLLFPDLSHLDDTPTIKVDLVALPDKDDNKAVPKPLESPKKEETAKKVEPPKPKEVAKPEPPPAPTTEKKEAPKVVEKKPDPAESVDDESAALDRLRQLKALENLKNIETAKTPQEANTAGPIKGNRLAAGDSIEGRNRIHYNNYKKDLQDAVKSKWDLPPWLQDGNLSAEALVKIDETGVVTEKQLIKSSGNSIYDKYVLETITKSSPFPPPPDIFVNVVAVKGVVLSFN